MLPTLALLLVPALVAEIPQPGVAALAWLEGTWVGEAGGVHQEEAWSGVAHGHLQGMYRELQEGRVKTLELLSLGSESDGLWLTMRHFDGALKPREPMDAPLRWRVAVAEPDHARFVNAAAGATLEYWREGRTLRIRLEIARKDKAFVETFALRRKNQ